MKKQSASAVSRRSRCVRMRLKPLAAALIALGLVSLGAQAGPQGGVVRAGDAQIVGGGAVTRVEQQSARAVIDWRSFGIGAAEMVQFLQPSTQAATLNRVTGEQASVILGRMDANGQVLLINPYGIVFGRGAQVNVGSLIASTSNISNSNFMAGRLVFDQPGKPGAGILNAGTITAAEGGLVTLVAPHVRNDGLIQARLGKVVLGAADTFTIDLYGDGLVNLALSDMHAGQLLSADGQPVANLITHTGRIDAAGGQAVLITAANAKNVLDNLINMSGTIKADTAVQQGGRILLLGEGGKVDVSGALSAQGATGGRIQVLGDDVHLASTANLNASGAQGGGVIHVGGAYQGTGDTYRARQTTVDPGAILKANATERGDGGEVVVWSDGQTAFSGAIEARGGANGGDGGRTEVSGKGTLAFNGTADASAANGVSGSLLLDPAYLNIGLSEAGIIGRVLRTGTSTTLQADVDINVNAAIDGRGRYAGGGLTMTAGNNINLNDFVLTNNGAINLFATAGTVNILAGKAVFAGAAPITVRTGGTLHTGPLITSGALTLASTAGAIAIDSFIDGNTGAVSISAAGDVDINQPIVNLVTGKPLNVSAGNNINVNAQVDGRGGVAGGAVALTAARNVSVNDFVVTNNGAIGITASNGTAGVASGKGLFAGTAPIAINAKGDIATGMSSSGALTLTSSAGAVAVNGLIDGATGAVNINAATDVNVNQPIVNLQSGNALTVNTGNDINVNAQIDGRGGVAGGSVALTAARNVSVDNFIVTNNGAIGITASNGTASVAAGKELFAGTAPISMITKGNIVTGASSSGVLTVASSSGSVALNGVIDSRTGAVNVSAGTDVNINQPVLNLSTGNALTVSAGNDINVNAPVDGRGGVAGGAVTLTASRNLSVNDFIVTNNGAISLTATNGIASVAATKGLFAGTAPIAMNAKGNVTAGVMSGGPLTVASSAGAVALNGPVTGSGGPIGISAAGAVDINQAITNPASASPLTILAGTNINLNAQIDGRDANAAAPSGAVTMTAGQNINLNDSIVTENAAIGLTAQNGIVTTAAGKGLFAGSAPIAVTSGGTLSTGILTTTGSLTLRSTAGSLSVDAPFDGTTGAVTLTAAGAVNLNQPIANPRSDAPLTVNAGTSINVNAPIDGRDLNAASPSGTVTMTAGQNISLNQSIVSENAAITLTAQNGALTTAATKGLFAGNAPISVTSGATLNTGILSTTGALNIRSTAGAVNVSTPIDDTTGAVTINAATAVNVNQTITNIKTGNPLSITAGTDLNLNAQIDGRNGTAAGGAVTLTAGNNLRLFDNIVTNDGAINLTTITGSVFLAPVSQDANLLILATPKQVRAGSAPITIVSGGNFSTGAPPPQPIPNPTHGETDGKAYARDFLKQYVQLVTTGPLNITSTNGNVNVDAPISDMTGPVTITAGNAINVKHKINSDNQPITLNGGTGGINVFAVDDSCGGICITTSPVDARMANLTLNSIGDVSITTNGVATAKTLTIDTRSKILTGSIGQTSDGGHPSKVVLIADQGIPSFDVGPAGEVSATSIRGSINLGVESPGKLRITTGTPDPNNPTAATDCTGCNISTGGFIGPDVVLNAGGSINLSDSSGTVLSLIARAGDVNLGRLLLGAFGGGQLTVNAGQDVNMSGLIWVGPQPSSSAASGPVSVTAGRDIATTASSPIHVSNGQNLTLDAGRNVTLNLLETLGPVNITATAGNITLNNDIGPHISNGTLWPDFNPSDLGVASLSMSAPAATAAIHMQGARAQGDITISTGGTLSAAKAITSVSGTKVISAAGGSSIGATAIGTQNQIDYPLPVLPAISPGPTVPPPAAPGLAGAPAPGFPLLLEIAVADRPGSVGTVVQPGATGDTVAAPGTTGAIMTLPGSSLGGSVASPAGSSDEGTVDTASAQRAAQQTSTAAEAAGSDATLVALASSDSEAAGQQAVLCPAGVAPGSSLQRKDAAGRAVTVTCK